MTASSSRFLSKDAFLVPAVEKKGEEEKVSAYKNLYGDQLLNKEYIKEPTSDADRKDESPENKNNREQFQQQFYILLAALEKWGAENKCEFQSHIPDLKERFFVQHWSGMHAVKWFENYKANLEAILLRTQRSELREIDKVAINFMLLDAFQKTTCSIGSGNDVATLIDILNNEISLSRWLSRFCNEIVDNFAAEHIKKLKIREGIRNHVYLACRQVVRDNGWPCSYDTSGTNDPYAADAKLEPEHLSSLLKIVQATFTPKNILTRILKDFKNEFQNLYPLGDVEWVCYDKKRVTNIEFIFKQLELEIKPIHVFDLSEDSTCIRLNEIKFKHCVLKELHEKKKLFQSERWRTIHLEEDTIFLMFDDKDSQTELFYLKDKENDIYIPFEKILRLCQTLMPVQQQIQQLMIRQVDETLELEKAIKEKNKKLFIGIIDAGYPVTRKNKQGFALFMLAASFPWIQPEILSWLVDLPDVNLDQVNKGYTALMLAALNGQTEKVKRLIFKCRIRKSKTLNEQLNYALYVAAVNGHFEIVELLLIVGVSITELYKIKINKKTALDEIVAAEKWDMFIYLIKSGYSLRAKNKEKHTPIQIAARKQKWDIVKTILNEFPADKDDAAHYGSCMLHAVTSSKGEIIEHLLKFKAHLGWRSWEGFTPFHIAISRNNIINESKENLALAQRLLNAGADVNFIGADADELSPLQMAACKSEVEIKTLAWLLERKGIEINKPGKDGNTALMRAVEVGSLEKAALLLSCKADFRLKRKDGKTVLDIAKEGKHEKTTELLTLLFSCEIASIKENLNHANFEEAVNSLLLIQSCDQLIFSNLLSDLEPHLVNILIDETTGYDMLLRTCVVQAANAKKPAAIKAILEKDPSLDFFFHILSAFLLNNQREQAEVLLTHYQANTAHLKHSRNPFKVICSDKVTLETFKWLLSHPKFKQDIYGARDVYVPLLGELISNGVLYKVTSLLKMNDLQWILATVEMKEISKTANASQQMYEINAHTNKAILKMLIRILKKDFTNLIDTFCLVHKDVINILLDAMPEEEDQKNRIRFILNEFSNIPVEMKLGLSIEANLDWYNQAFLFASCSLSRGEKYESRLQHIRERAFEVFQQQLVKLDITTKNIDLIIHAKSQPVFCKPIGNHFQFFAPPSFLIELDGLVKQAQAKLIFRSTLS